jgi:hypothetical protein
MLGRVFDVIARLSLVALGRMFTHVIVPESSSFPICALRKMAMDGQEDMAERIFDIMAKLSRDVKEEIVTKVDAMGFPFGNYEFFKSQRMLEKARDMIDGFSLDAQMEILAGDVVSPLPLLVRHAPEMLGRVFSVMERFPPDVQRKTLEVREIFPTRPFKKL